ncbi:multiple epidermal growth factor-like domains protein 11 [Ylistrum balloti]|uniref:multiple epidermal growth factor-like domains protein 11 n=1 Tax=Ylistrum balloti TaxID=509963 RepID=UPI002905F20F|nr:multiple epidermal growth factor-like domains protein 11 [Ylistrum balloti]
MAVTRAVFTRDVFLILFIFLQTSRSESNLALLKNASQSSDLGDTWTASKVVDNCVATNIAKGCCTHTKPGVHKEAWWRVDLGELMTVDKIKIYYRHGFQYRLAGYHLYLSNTTDTPTQGALCYEDKSIEKTDVQLVVTHQCPYVAQYVTVYNYRNNTTRKGWYSKYAVLELCEVQVFGCQVGSYGDGDCDNLCPDNCYGGNCNPTTGSCLYCFPGNYGINCNNICPVNCGDSICEKDTGFCFRCVSRKHGTKCEDDCPVNCKDTCGQDTGNCNECVSGKHGTTCEGDCPVNCKDTCEQDTGNCNGCVSGKRGPTCEDDCPVNCKDMCEQDTENCNECVSGRRGTTCEDDCPVNCKDACEQYTGNCNECVSGRRGTTCEDDCPVNCKNTCEQETGNCSECTTGKYGDGCAIDCPMNCKDSMCHRKTGLCYDCIIGTYGATCSLTCPVTCKDFVCDQQTGQCLECYPGKYGVVCGADCPDTCTDNTCNKDDGHCISAADAKLIIMAVLCGLLIAVVITTVICLLRLHRRNEIRKKSPDQDKESPVPDPNYTSLSNEQGEAPHIYEMIVK